ncbi:MAG: DNA gyrase modulator, partial [Candidatus Puniceispirillum sp.]
METDNQTFLAQLLDAAKSAGADGADVMLARGQSTDVTMRLGKVEASERSEEFDVGLRVFVGQHTASVSTSQLDTKTINELATRAVAMAQLAPADPYVRLATAEEIAKTIPDLDMFDPAMPDAAALQDRAAAAEDAANSNKAIKTVDHASAGHGIVDVLIGTSAGFLAGYQRSSHGISAVVIAERDGHMERDYDYSAAVYGSDLESAETVGKNAARRAAERLGASKPQTGSCPLFYVRRVAPA